MLPNHGFGLSTSTCSLSLSFSIFFLSFPFLPASLAFCEGHLFAVREAGFSERWRYGRPDSCFGTHRLLHDPLFLLVSDCLVRKSISRRNRIISESPRRLFRGESHKAGNLWPERDLVGISHPANQVAQKDEAPRLAPTAPKPSTHQSPAKGPSSKVQHYDGRLREARGCYIDRP